MNGARTYIIDCINTVLPFRPTRPYQRCKEGEGAGARGSGVQHSRASAVLGRGHGGVEVDLAARGVMRKRDMQLRCLTILNIIDSNVWSRDRKAMWSGVSPLLSAPCTWTQLREVK
jgi:hypothetical protein